MLQRTSFVKHERQFVAPCASIGRWTTPIAAAVYPAAVSDKPPQTYILHTVALFAVLIVVMVLFLRHQWG